MGESRQNIANLVFAFADAVNSMDDREFDLLIQGKAKLRVIKNQEERQKTGRKSLDDSCLDEALIEMARKLNNAESREVAGTLLASINQPRRRDFLVLLAKACNVRVGSKDSIAKIEQMLIENVVGSRLRSEAIKNVAF